MSHASAGQLGDPQVSAGQVRDEPVPAGHAEPDIWHYKDERGGGRVGPVDRGTIAELIKAKRIDRSTLVWHPALVDWVKAGHSELSSLFGNEPPPLPASEIRHGAIYLLALFPLWGMLIQLLASVPLARQLAIEPREVFDHWGWLIAFIVGNGVLAEWDEHNLRKGGLGIRGAALLGALLVPFYILRRCHAVFRRSGRRGWLAYGPALLWLLAFVAAIAADPLAFNPDAPALFNPDGWL